MKFFVKANLFFLAVIFIGREILSFFIQIPETHLNAVSISAGISVVFVVSGFLSFVLARKFKTKRFVYLILGSTLGRMIFILAALIVIIKNSLFDLKTLTVSLLCFYFILQIIEIIGFTKLQPEEL